MSRLLKTGEVRITQEYKKGTHDAVDLVKAPSSTDIIKAHSSGTVIFCQTGQKNNKGSTGNASYGNCVKIQHANGYCTLYAHLSSVSVKLNQQVAQGQDIGVMGNTGNSYGAHLHFEVWKDGKRIDPTPYLENDFPTAIGIKYRSHDAKKKMWLPEVYSGSDYAGNFGNAIDAVMIEGATYMVHEYKGVWLPQVNGYSLKDDINGYAGNLGRQIDAIAIKIDKPYRVKELGGKWLPWVTGFNINDHKNGYAGNIGKPIDAIEIGG